MASLGSIFTAFNRRNSIVKDNSSIPFLNEPNATISPMIQNVQSINRKKKYVAWYKNIPELTALINKVAVDTCEHFYFEPVDKNKSNRNKVLKAKEFATNVQLRRNIHSIIIDALITGEAYNWVGKLKKEQVNAVIESRVKELGFPLELKEVFYKANFSDEELLKPRKLRYVASSTMDNLYDELDVIGYRQKVGAIDKHYSVDEIIHYKFFDVDGKVGGFTPVSSLEVQFILVDGMWKNQLSLINNGGQPDRVFSVENVDINNPSFKRMEQELKKYYGLMNRHGSLLLNGKVTVQDLTQLDSMQFKEMGLYITGLIAMQWGIPRSSIPYIVGGTNTQADTGGNSEKGYWRNIEMFQDLVADYYNTQLFIPYFGVELCFEKGYKHDELVEAQVEQTRLNNMTFLNNILAKNKKQLNVEYVMRELDIDEDDLEEFQMDPMQQMQQEESQFRQNLASNKDLASSKDGKNIRDNKADTAKKASKTNDTLGYGKEVVVEDKVDIKELSIKERQRLGFQTFLKIYNEDKAFNLNPPRLFISENDGITRLAYRSTDFTYETLIPSANLSQTVMMNFRKVYKVQEDELLSVLDSPVSNGVVDDNVREVV